jgi:hypothetical protein
METKALQTLSRISSLPVAVRHQTSASTDEDDPPPGTDGAEELEEPEGAGPPPCVELLEFPGASCVSHLGTMLAAPLCASSSHRLLRITSQTAPVWQATISSLEEETSFVPAEDEEEDEGCASRDEDDLATPDSKSSGLLNSVAVQERSARSTNAPRRECEMLFVFIMVESPQKTK